MTDRLHIRLLGELDIQPIFALPDRFGRKAQALVVYLAVEQKNQSIDKLLTLFWNGDSNRRNRLDNELTYVRKLFIEGSLPIKDGVVQWNVPVEALILDISQFEVMERQASKEALETAVQLYRGDFWADCTLSGNGPEFDDWLLAQRQRWQERLLRILETLSLNAPDGLAIAHDHLVRLLRLDPTHEQANQLHLRYLLQNGRINTALKFYNQYLKCLQEDFGVSPTAAMQRMHQRIISARNPHTSTLPAPLLPIVGRSGELQQICQQLMEPDCRLITISGVGGMGKTRLAQEAAHHGANAFLDGVCFLDVTAVPHSQLIYCLADALNISLHGKHQPENALFTEMRYDERLLVFDSFENQLPEGRDFVYRLLTAVPRLKCLVTSREHLNLRGEWLLPLAGLSLSDDKAQNKGLAKSAAVQLFWQRARQSRPDFSPTSEEESILQICSLTDGMPLAIELAAYWVRDHSCSEILTLLRKNLAALNWTGTDAPSRHWSIKAAFDHSWHNLSEDEQSAFAGLALFPGTISPEAAKAVAFVEQAKLTSLVNKSMLTQVKSGQYRLHPLLQQYGLEKLKTTKKLYESGQMRLIEYYATFLTNRDLTRPTNQESQFQEIAAEVETLHVIWETAVHLQAVELLPQLLHGLWSYYEFTGLFLLGYQQLTFALDELINNDSRSMKLQLAIGILFARRAWFAFHLGRFIQGVEDADKSIQILSHLPMPEAQVEYGRSLNICGLLDWYLGYFEQATARIEQAQQIFQKSGDEFGSMLCSLYHGFVYEARGNYQAAFDHFFKALSLGHKMEEHRGTFVVCARLSRLFLIVDDIASANIYLAQALDEKKQMAENPFGTAVCLLAQAKLDLKMQEVDLAQKNGQQALSICETIGERWLALSCRLHLSELDRQQKSFAKAAAHYKIIIDEGQAMCAAPMLLAGCAGLLITDWEQSWHLSPISHQLLQTIGQHPALEDVIRAELQKTLDTAVPSFTSASNTKTEAIQRKVISALAFLDETYHV